MANDVESFSRRMTLRGGKIAEGADKLVRKVALVIDQAVVIGTPVDTGRARSNWIVQIGSPAEGTIPTHGTGAAQAAVVQGQSVIRNYIGGSGLSIHITNNLPYIGRLNEGWSKQAPANFVQEAAREAASAVAGAQLVEGKA